MDVVWHYLQTQYLYPLLLCYGMEYVFEMVCYIASKYRTLVFGYPYQMVIYIILTMPSRPHFHDRLYVRIL